MKAVRSVCLYSSGISYAIVKIRFPPHFMRRAWLAGIVQKFSRASRIGKFSFAPALFPGKLCEIDQCFVRQACDLKSLEYRRKHIYPNGIRTSGSFPAAPQCFPVLAKAFASLVFPASDAPSCSALEPAATIDFLRDPLAFHWAIPCAFSIFARSFLRLRWGWPVRRETTRGEI